MSFERYDIYFSGQLLPGQDEVEARARIGKLFKAGDEQLDRLFSGRPIRIKANVDMDKAIRYRVMFRDAGALVDIRPVEPTTERTEETPPEPRRKSLRAPDRIPAFEVLPARTGSLEDCAPRIAPYPLPDLSALTLEPAGTPLDETPPPPAAEIDIDGLSALPPNSGSLEGFRREVEPWELPDISALRLV